MLDQASAPAAVHQAQFYAERVDPHDALRAAVAAGTLDGPVDHVVADLGVRSLPTAVPGRSLPWRLILLPQRKVVLLVTRWDDRVVRRLLASFQRWPARRANP